MKKFFVVLLTLIMLTVVFVGCGDKDKSSDGKTVIKMTSAYSLTAFEAAFEEKYPDIDLQIETMATATINGEVTRRLRKNHGSDIIITNLPAGEIENYTYDLSAEKFVERYQSSIIKSVTFNGQNKYLPLPGAYYGYIINKTMVEGLGLSMPETRQDLLNILSVAKSATTGVAKDVDYGFGLSDAGATFIGAYYAAEFATDYLVTVDGQRWLANFENKTATFTGTWESSINFIKTCIDSGYMDADKVIVNYNGHMDSNSNAFKAETNLPNRTAILTYGNIETLELVQSKTDDEIVMLPCLPDTTSGTKLLSAVSNDYIAINKAIADDSDKLDGALQVLDYLSTTEGQEKWIEDTSCYHSYLDGYTVNTTKLPESIRQYASAGMIFSNPFPTNILSYVGKNLAEASKGKVTIAQALANIDNYYINGDDDVEYDMSVVGSVSKDMLYENSNTRKGETEIGNFISDAIREVTGADVALVNGGGIRSSLYKGDITGDDLSYVCPYGNKIIVATITGKTLKEAITNGIQKTWKPAGQFLQVSGIKYSFTPAKNESETAVLLTLKYPDGRDVQDTDTLTVAYTNYMGGSSGYVDAGDGFTMLNVYDDTLPKVDTNFVETNKTYCDALKEYFANHKDDDNLSASIEGRIVVVNN